ncbi:MAG: transposase [Hyphomicrobiales bacterium]|nr:transposase [Hyphomicrobiales bacterium]
MAGVVERRNGEIERLQIIIKQLQRAQFGRRSKSLHPDQLALGLDEIDADMGCIEASSPNVLRQRSTWPRQDRHKKRAVLRGLQNTP